MKKLLFTTCLFLVVQYLFSQIPNSDMENWTFGPTLIGWETNSHPLTTPPIDPYVVKKDSDAYSGSWAADLHANGVFKAFAKTIFAVPSDPQHLSLYYKLLFPPCVNDSINYPKDTVSVLLELLSNGTVVDSGYWQSTVANFNYSQLIVPLSQNATTFDSCRITLTGGDVLGGCGIVAASTEFIVDHLELKYESQNACVDSARLCDTCFCPQVVAPVCGCNGVTYNNFCYAQNAGITSWAAGSCPTGINNVSFPEGYLILFPVPANNVLNVQYELLNPGNSELNVSNMLGQTLTTEKGEDIPGKYQMKIDLSNLASGIYFVELKTGSNRIVKRFVKE